MNEEAPVPGRYVQVDAVDIPEVRAVSAGERAIVVVDSEGTVTLFTPGRTSTVAQREAVRDVAVADRVYILTESGLEAFSHAGSRVWSVDVAEGRSVDADPVGDHVYVRTAAGEFESIEGRTGVETGWFEQPHAEVAESPAVAAYDGILAVASWSFLTVLDAAGDRLEEYTLSGAVTDLGLLDDVAVVSLKDGQLAGYTDGERVWEVDGDASWLADAGVERLAGRIDGESVAVDPDGSRYRLEGLSGQPIAATPDLGLLCAAGSGTLTSFSTLTEADEAVGIAIRTETIRPTEPEVVVEFENEGDGAVEVEADVEIDGATVAASELNATIEAGTRHRRRLSLQSVSADEVTVTVSVGETATTRTIPVREATTALDVETDLQAVEFGVLTATIEVTNEGETPVSGLAVGETRLANLAPGKSTRVQIERDLPSGPTEVRAAGIESMTADTSVDATPTGIELAADPNGFLEVTLRNDTPVPVTDEVSIEGVPKSDGSVSLSVEIPANGAYRALLPVAEASERQVEVEAAAGRVAERLSLTRCTLLPEPTVGASREPNLDAGQAGGEQFSSSSSASSDSAPDRDEPPVSIERTIPEAPPRGIAIEETLVLSNNRDDSVTVDLKTDDGSYERTLRVKSESDVVGTRYHALFGSTATFPAVELTYDGEAVSVPAQERSVSDGSLVPMLMWTAADDTDRGSVSVALQSDAGEWTVSQVAFEDESSVAVDETVTPNEPARATLSTSYTPEDDVERAFVRARRTDSPESESQTIQTLVARESELPSTPSAVDDLTVVVEDDSRVASGLGSLFLTIRNEGPETVEGVAVDAEGDAVEKSMYADGDEGADLAPGESLRYLVDLEEIEPSDVLLVQVRLSAADGGWKQVAITAMADESAAVAPEDWTREAADGAFDFPSHLSTLYE